MKVVLSVKRELLDRDVYEHHISFAEMTQKWKLARKQNPTETLKFDLLNHRESQSFAISKEIVFAKVVHPVHPKLRELNLAKDMETLN